MGGGAQGDFTSHCSNHSLEQFQGTVPCIRAIRSTFPRQHWSSRVLKLEEGRTKPWPQDTRSKYYLNKATQTLVGEGCSRSHGRTPGRSRRNYKQRKACPFISQSGYTIPGGGISQGNRPNTYFRPFPPAGFLMKLLRTLGL